MKKLREKWVHVESRPALHIHWLSYCSPTTLLIICRSLSLSLSFFGGVERWSVNSARRWDAIRSWREGEVLVISLQRQKGFSWQSLSCFSEAPEGSCCCMKDGVMQRDGGQKEEGVVGLKDCSISSSQVLEWCYKIWECLILWFLFFSTLTLRWNGRCGLFLTLWCFNREIFQYSHEYTTTETCRRLLFCPHYNQKLQC